jgi:hypothetical protein
MVRLVFRPYTQIWRSICTSESLRASTRVSPGFTLFKHSSPSFGSQHICSNSNLSPRIMIGRWCTPPNKRGEFPPQFKKINLHFHCASGFATQTLAHMLDSLVRVSRRVGYSHFVHITMLQIPEGSQSSVTLLLGLQPWQKPKDITLISPKWIATSLKNVCHSIKPMWTCGAPTNQCPRALTYWYQQHWLQSLPF